jgi:SAM-dependent methyltransferase
VTGKSVAPPVNYVDLLLASKERTRRRTGRLADVIGPAERPGGLTLTRAVLKACALKPGSVVYDVACGLGSTLTLLARLGFEAEGLDADPTAAAEAEAVSGRPALVGEMTALPWPSDSAEGVFCECALGLARDRSKVLGEFRRVLKIGGRLALSDLALRSPQGPPAPAGAIAASDLKAAVESAGFEIILTEDRLDDLRSLAAKLVWESGSTAALSELTCPALDGRGATPPLTYVILAAEKK